MSEIFTIAKMQSKKIFLLRRIVELEEEIIIKKKQVTELDELMAILEEEV